MSEAIATGVLRKVDGAALWIAAFDFCFEGLKRAVLVASIQAIGESLGNLALERAGGVALVALWAWLIFACYRGMTALRSEQKLGGWPSWRWTVLYGMWVLSVCVNAIGGTLGLVLV